MKTELTIVKIGGNIIDNKKQLHSFLEKFHAINGLKILVHGGGKLATDLLPRLGIEPKMVDGRRITDLQTLEVVVMVYSGINKSIVAQLSAISYQLSANKFIGICGADLNLLPAKKREKGNTESSSAHVIDYGFAGDIIPAQIPVNEWKMLLDASICPVMSPITADTSGQLLNTNADTIASSLAQALSNLYSVKLIYCFEKNGVLKNPADNDSVIKQIEEKEYTNLKEQGIISAGMIPKLDNAYQALKEGVAKVIIGNALDIDKLTATNHETGTVLSL